MRLIKKCLVFPSTEKLDSDIEQARRMGVLVQFDDFDVDFNMIVDQIKENPGFNKVQSKEITIELLNDLKLYKDANPSRMDEILFQRVRTPILWLENKGQNMLNWIGYKKYRTNVSAFMEINNFRHSGYMHTEKNIQLYSDVAEICLYGIVAAVGWKKRRNIVEISRVIAN